MKQFAIIFVSVFLVSCGATVNYDYDTQKDFSGYKTYDFYPEIDSGLSELDNFRVMKMTDSILQTNGFIKSKSPDFLINFYVKEFITNSGTTLGVGVGGGGYNGSVGVSAGIPVGGDVYKQKFTLDYIDNKGDKLFWQAVGNDDLKVKANTSQKDNYYFKLLNKMIKGFPPEK